jgi:hypothetical protein
MTKDEARRAVETELWARNPKQRMTPTVMVMFCQEMHSRHLGNTLSDIRYWAELWQFTWLRSN